MELQNIYSKLSSADRVKVVNRQKSTLRERSFAKEFSKKREGKQKKKKGSSLSLTEDVNDLVEISEKEYGNKRHAKNMNNSRLQKEENGELIDITV
ncbi:MAG: hypothetical protein JJV89_01795 [Desulfosarcina sp.]|nr:hypothetical protein [Desulfobacterales bacterium]